MLSAVIDVQCVVDSDLHMVIKEICIADAQRATHVMHWLVQHPPTFRLSPQSTKVNVWLQTHFHGIRYTDGHIPYSELARVLGAVNSRYTAVYVKGIQKRNLLQRYLPKCTVIDLEAYGCPKCRMLQQQQHVCPFHSDRAQNKTCAKAQCLALRVWMDENIGR